MALKLFGPEIAPYAAVACVISFLMTGHRSVHPTQVLSMRKSASSQVEIGEELQKIKAQFRPRDKNLIGIARKMIHRLKKKKAQQER